MMFCKSFLSTCWQVSQSVELSLFNSSSCFLNFNLRFRVWIGVFIYFLYKFIQNGSLYFSFALAFPSITHSHDLKSFTSSFRKMYIKLTQISTFDSLFIVVNSIFYEMYSMHHKQYY